MTTAHGNLDAHTPDDPYYEDDIECPCGFLITVAGHVIFEYEKGDD